MKYYTLWLTHCAATTQKRSIHIQHLSGSASRGAEEKCKLGSHDAVPVFQTPPPRADFIKTKYMCLSVWVFFFLVFIYVHECLPACVPVYHTCVLHTEARGGCQIPWV